VQAITRGRWLHHTTFLWDFDDAHMALLRHPGRAPAYREVTACLLPLPARGTCPIHLSERMRKHTRNGSDSARPSLQQHHERWHIIAGMMLVLKLVRNGAQRPCDFVHEPWYPSTEGKTAQLCLRNRRCWPAC
jgi:hypothetical protein